VPSVRRIEAAGKGEMFWIVTTTSASAANVRPTLLERTRKGRAHSVMEARRGCWRTTQSTALSPRHVNGRHAKISAIGQSSGELAARRRNAPFQEVVRWEWLGWV
jgi:hypothetical protein